jgi:hypothetical protein
VIRIAALPASFAGTSDLIVEDVGGSLYLLDRAARRLVPLPDAEANIVINFYEPSQDYTWYSETELFRRLDGTGLDGVVPMPHHDPAEMTMC